MRLVLVRHGQSRWNVEGRWQGHEGDGLTALGRHQARLAAERVAARYRDVRLLARSDLARVVESAAPFQARLRVPVTVDPRLRELDIGCWAGLTRAEVAASDPEGFAAWQRGDDVVIGGGERLGDLRARVREALRDLAGRVAGCGGGTAVAVTHGGCMRAAVAGLLDLDGWAWRELPPVANGSITELAWDGDRVRLVRWADGEHLDSPSPTRTGASTPL